MRSDSTDGGNDSDGQDASDGSGNGSEKHSGDEQSDCDRSGDGQSDTGQSVDRQSDTDQSGGGPSGGSGSQREDRPSRPEKVVMVVSVTFTVLLFAYAGWQMATVPETTTPQATVEGTETIENGSVAVTVRLRNPSDVGLVSATVSSNCTSPPAEKQFSFVPAASDRTATLVCPPGTTDPSVSIANWERR